MEDYESPDQRLTISGSVDRDAEVDLVLMDSFSNDVTYYIDRREASRIVAHLTKLFDLD